MPNLDMTSQSPAAGSSGSSSPTPSTGSGTTSSLSLSSIATAAMTADIRITYSSVGDNNNTGNNNNNTTTTVAPPTTHLARPEVIALIDAEALLAATGSSSASSPSSDCISSNMSLNSPGAHSLGSPKVATTPSGGLTCKTTANRSALGFAPSRSLLSISRASSMDEGCFPSPLNSPARSTPSSPIGPRYKIIHEGEIHLCRLNHQRTVISKILSSKFLRRWESHRLYLTSVNIASKTVSVAQF